MVVGKVDERRANVKQQPWVRTTTAEVLQCVQAYNGA